MNEKKCRHCNGTGKEICYACAGTGSKMALSTYYISMFGYPLTETQICYNCHGTGKEKCMYCNGTGII